MTTDSYSPQKVADRMRIQDVIYRWCRAVDRLDKQGMLDVFWPGAIDSHGPYIGPAEGLIDWILERHKPIATSSHFVGNLLIEFVSDDVALVETYVRTVQQYPPDAKQQLAQLTGGAAGDPGAAMDMFTSSRYLDRMERRDGEWRIAHRDLVQDWKQIVDVKYRALTPAEGWIIGRRDGKDQVQAERRRLGID